MYAGWLRLFAVLFWPGEVATRVGRAGLSQHSVSGLRSGVVSSLHPRIVFKKISTADEISDKRKDKAFDLAIRATVNGREYARANFSEIYWSFEEMLSFASRGTNLLSGDILGSGTCGTGCIAELSLTHGEDKYPWLVPGDVVEITVDSLGTLRNEIVAGPPLHPLR